jgi:[ribosomal protein S18]-alanine N-acetyltransferase
MEIEPLRETHLDIVEAIEARDGDVKWSRAQFAQELENEFIRFFVATSEAGILGYAGYRKADTEAQVTNLVVRKESQCQGVGKRLLEFLLDCARGESCKTCTLEVRASNAHAQALYQKLGFEKQNVRKKMYQNPEEAGLLMEKKL